MLKHLQTRKQRSIARVAALVVYRKSKTCRGPVGVLGVGEIN